MKLIGAAMAEGSAAIHKGRMTVVAATVAGLTVLCSPAAIAAVIVPTTAADDNVANGNCTLREAVRAADADAPVDACPVGSGPDQIQLARGTYSLGIDGTGEDAAQSGDLDITGDLAITGDLGGSIIDGGGIDRVFHVHSGQLSLEILTVRGGDARSGGLLPDPGGDDGGAVLADGGAVRIYRTTLTGNTAADGGALAIAGANVSISASTLSGNTATGRGGGIFAEAGSAEVSMSTVTANGAGQGSSIRATGAGSLIFKGSIVGVRCGELASGVTSQGYNLFGGPELSGCVPDNLQPTDIWDGIAHLMQLGDFGGPTPTLAFAIPLPSEAIGAGPLAIDPSCGGQVDQRGIPRPRPRDGRCDIGAVEYEALHPYCGVGRFIFLGTAASDELNGTEETDTFLAEGGDDSLFGLGDHDCLDGGKDKDRLEGGEGDDVLVGEEGKDRLFGQEGEDELYGGTGGGKLKGGPGDDELLDASLVLGQVIPVGGADRAVLKGGAGEDLIDGWDGRDRISGGSGDDEIDGGRGRDRIRCGGGRDRVVADKQDRVARDCERIRKQG